MTPAYAVSRPSPLYHPRQHDVRTAEQELGAFLAAVQQKFGPQAATPAADFWLQAFEDATQDSSDKRHFLLTVTIAAASRLADQFSETMPTHIS